MAESRRSDPDADPFRPPEVPVEVSCLHCGRTYDSYLIEWREYYGENDEIKGFWCCPTPGCDGLGFGFDILPTDPDYRDEYGGWVSFDDEEEEEYDEDDYDQELDEQDLFEEDSQPPPRPGGNHKSNGNGNGNGRHGTGDDIPW